MSDLEKLYNKIRNHQDGRSMFGDIAATIDELHAVEDVLTEEECESGKPLAEIIQGRYERGRQAGLAEDTLSFGVLSDMASRKCETLGSKINEECGETVPYCLPCRARNAVDSVNKDLRT